MHLTCAERTVMFASCTSLNCELMNEEIVIWMGTALLACIKSLRQFCIYLKYDSTCVALGVHFYCTHEQFIAFALVVL